MPKHKFQRTHYKPEEYSFSVVWSDDDKAFIGRVAEFPSLATHGATQEKALREIQTVVEYVLRRSRIRNEVLIPVDLAEFQFRTKIRVWQTS